MNLGPAEIGLIPFAVMLLFGYRKLPDASRSLGRSLRIFQREINDLRDDPRPAPSTDIPPATVRHIRPTTVRHLGEAPAMDPPQPPAP